MNDEDFGRLEACPPSGPPSVLPVSIPLVGWLFRASTAALPPAREKALSLKLSHSFYMSVIDKSKDVAKTAE